MNAAYSTCMDVVQVRCLVPSNAQALKSSGQRPRRACVLSGPEGIGKTVAAACLAEVYMFFGIGLLTSRVFDGGHGMKNDTVSPNRRH